MPFGPIARRATIFVVLDTGLIVCAVAGTSLFSTPVVLHGWWIAKAVAVSVVYQLFLYGGGAHDGDIAADPPELALRLATGVGAASIALGVLSAAVPGLIVMRDAPLLGTGVLLGVLYVWRRALAWAAYALGARERLAIVAADGDVAPTARELAGRSLFGRTELVGLIAASCPGPPSHRDIPVLGSLDEIADIVKAHRINRLAISISDARGRLPMDQLLDLKLNGVGVEHFTSTYERCTGKIAITNLRPSWLVFSPGFEHTASAARVKRLFDVVAATLGLVVASPVMAVVAVAVPLASPGPALYRQRRVGQRGRIFTLLKFRSMRVDAEAATGPVWAEIRDQRLTPIGWILRSTRLDELPQLWNVLRGDMSIVGPRPERPEFVGRLTAQIPFYDQRHSVKPGITGWAQVRYAYGASVEDTIEKLQYDLFYVKYASLAFDLFIAFATLRTLALRQGR